MDNAKARQWRFTQAIRQLLGFRSISGTVLEIVVGHFVSFVIRSGIAGMLLPRFPLGRSRSPCAGSHREL